MCSRATVLPLWKAAPRGVRTLRCFAASLETVCQVCALAAKVCAVKTSGAGFCLVCVLSYARGGGEGGSEDMGRWVSNLPPE